METGSSIDLDWLSPRETEVFELLAQDMSPDKVAKKLHITPSTVKQHIYNGKQKTGAKTTIGLAAAIAVQKIKPSEQERLD